MAQSKPSYGAKVRKGTENEHCQSQNTNAAERESGEAPEPACWRRRVDDWEWYETKYTAAFAEMYGPCPECFIDGPPDASEIESVVRSCSYPTKYHQIADSAKTDTRKPAHATDTETTTATAAPRFSAASIGAREPISDVTELQEGDGVLWEGQSTPLLVIEPASTSDGVVQLRGPSGGEYRIEGRPEYSRPYYVRPGYACQAEISRVVPADDQPRPEPEKV